MSSSIIFSIIELFQLLHSKFFAILEFLGNSLHDLAGKLGFSFLILHIASSSPLESDQSIDLPDLVPSFGNWSCMPVSQRAISAFRIFHSLLSNSDCASDNLV